jgi:hypothetical protein
MSFIGAAHHFERVSATVGLSFWETGFCGAETAATKRPVTAETKPPARKPTNSAPFARHREISVCMGLRGGVGRTRTSNQAVIAKRWAKHAAAVLPTSTIVSRKRRSTQYLSGKPSGCCLQDQLSIGREWQDLNLRPPRKFFQWLIWYSRVDSNHRPPDPQSAPPDLR